MAVRFTVPFHIHGTVAAQPTALGTVPFFKAPLGANGGGVTVLEAGAFCAGGGTAAIKIVDLGSAGNAAAGTIATLNITQTAVGTAAVNTACGYYLDPGDYVGFVTPAAGTVTLPAGGWITCVQGK